ncbi:DNA breaking-rejoining enzyme, partial [Tricholoma matsutake]
LENIQGTRSRALWLPVTLNMLRGLKATLNLSELFDACTWAMAACAFFGMMRFGEVSVASRNSFSRAKHLKHSDAFLGSDLDGKHYAHLDLPSAKTAKPGKIQSIYLTAQGDVCPLKALTNLTQVVPARPNDPLFSWRDKHGEIRPMVKTKALLRINMILNAWGWGTAFGHSFRIGGASFFLAQGVNPEIVCLAGRWKSLAYKAYIQAFKQITSRHMSNLST